MTMIRVSYKFIIMGVDGPDKWGGMVSTYLVLTKFSVKIPHYNGVIMGAMASQITSFSTASSTVYSGADQRKHLSSTSLAFVRGIYWRPVNSPHKWPVTRKMFPFDDIIMSYNTFAMNFRKRKCAFQFKLHGTLSLSQFGPAYDDIWATDELKQ